MRRARPLLPRTLACAVLVAACTVWETTPAASAAGYRDRTPLPRSVSNPAPTPAPSHSAIDGGTILRTLLGLAVVLGIVYGIYWLQIGRAHV